MHFCQVLQQLCYKGYSLTLSFESTEFASESLKCDVVMVTLNQLVYLRMQSFYLVVQLLIAVTAFAKTT
jgi:hypothetical protein